MTIAFVSLMVFLGILLYCAIWVAHYWLYNFIYYKCKPISKKIEFSYWYEHSRAKEFFWSYKYYLVACRCYSSFWFYNRRGCYWL